MVSFLLRIKCKRFGGAKEGVCRHQGQLFPREGMQSFCVSAVNADGLCHRLGYADAAKDSCKTVHSSRLGRGSFSAWEESF